MLRKIINGFFVSAAGIVLLFNMGSFQPSCGFFEVEDECDINTFVNSCSNGIATNCVFGCGTSCWYKRFEIDCKENGWGDCVMTSERPYNFRCNSGVSGEGNGPWAACSGAPMTEPECSMSENKCLIDDTVAQICSEICCDEYGDHNCYYAGVYTRDCAAMNEGCVMENNEYGHLEASCK